MQPQLILQSVYNKTHNRQQEAVEGPQIVLDYVKDQSTVVYITVWLPYAVYARKKDFFLFISQFVFCDLYIFIC